MKISGKELLEILHSVGFASEGQSGNHFLTKKGSRTVLIPNEEELAEKTVTAIIDQAGLTSKDIVKIMSVQRGEQPPSLEAPAEQASSPGFFRHAWTACGWLAPVAALRILLGIMFLISAFEKAPWAPGPFGWLKPFLEGSASSTSIPIVKSFIQAVLLPNLAVFGWVQYIIEVFLGVCLVLGFLTPLVAFLGTFWVAFFSLLAVSLPDPFVLLYIVMWIASMIILWAARAGRSFGIDQAIAKKAGERKSESGFWRFMGWIV